MTTSRDETVRSAAPKTQKGFPLDGTPRRADDAGRDGARRQDKASNDETTRPPSPRPRPPPVLGPVPQLPIEKAYLRRLRRFGALSQADIAAIEAALGPVESHAAGDNLDLAAGPMFLISGWAGLSHALGDGRRQILALLLPGDTLGFDLLTRCPRAVYATALTPLRLRFAHPDLGAAAGRLARHFAAAAAAQQGRLIDHMVRLGRQTAYERMAHLLLEVFGRLAEIGETRGDSFQLPVKQEVLADALGLSLVHVNRTLQQMRRDGLIDMRGARMTLRDRPALQDACGWRS